MFRVVLDTNVIVSALLRENGPEDLILKLVLNAFLELCVSEPILAEYEQVLRRKKFSFDPAAVDRALAHIRKVATNVSPKRILKISPDEQDNRFLECAEACRADYLVTGNKRHFPKSWKRARIVNARELLGLIAQQA
jgi:putative PIN family toxin of toxin-antitoxin system